MYEVQVVKVVFFLVDCEIEVCQKIYKGINYLWVDSLLSNSVFVFFCSGLISFWLVQMRLTHQRQQEQSCLRNWG